MILTSHSPRLFAVEFYEGTEAEVPREELYLISEGQYKGDVKCIRDVEDALLGGLYSISY